MEGYSARVKQSNAIEHVFFPIAVFIYRTNSRNHDLMLTAPDTITSWIADGFALSTDNSISVSMPVSLRVFQPFFVSLTLPYSVIRGEKLEVRATVFNYLDVNLTVHSYYLHYLNQFLNNFLGFR